MGKHMHRSDSLSRNRSGLERIHKKKKEKRYRTTKERDSSRSRAKRVASGRSSSCSTRHSYISSISGLGDILARILDRLERLEEKFDGLSKDNIRENKGTSATVKRMSLEAQVTEEAPTNIPVTEEVPTTALVAEEVPTTAIDAEEQEMDIEVLNVLGDDSASENPKEFLPTRWNAWLKSGQTKEVKEALLKKHSRKGNCSLEAPEINPGIMPSLNESGQKRDKHFVQTQNLAGSGLSALGMAISSILKDEEEPVDRLKLLELLCDAGKCFVEVHHAQSKARAVYILPRLGKTMRDVLEKTKTDSFLWGKNLSEKIKEARAMEKISKDWKAKASGSSYKNPLKTTRALNWSGPSQGQQGSLRMGDRTRNNSRRFQTKFKQSLQNQRASNQTRYQPSQRAVPQQKL